VVGGDVLLGLGVLKSMSKNLFFFIHAKEAGVFVPSKFIQGMLNSCE
jgi:hypothetical protein